METARLIGAAIVETIALDPLLYTAIALTAIVLWCVWPRRRRQAIDANYVAWLERRADLFEGALRFYARPELYEQFADGCAILEDGGQTATEILARSQGETP